MRAQTLQHNRRRGAAASSPPPPLISCQSKSVLIVLCVAVLGVLALLAMPRGGADGPGVRVGAAALARSREFLTPKEPVWGENPNVPTRHQSHHHRVAGKGSEAKTQAKANNKAKSKSKSKPGSYKELAPDPLAAEFGLAEAFHMPSKEAMHDMIPRLDSVEDTVAAVYGPGVAPGDLPYPIGTWDEVNENTLVLLVVSDAVYQWWQLRIYLYHHARVNQPGKLVILMSSKNHKGFKVPHECDAPFSGCGDIFLTGDYTVSPEGDSFVVYNRAHGIREYVEHLEETGEIENYSNVLIVEPDMVLLKPMLMVAQHHAPIGFHYFYMEESYFWGNNTELLKVCTTRPQDATAIGVPYIISMDDLRTILAPWIKKTVVMRLEQPWVEGHPRSWIADMWGFACAASDMGWTGTYDDPQLAPEPPIDQNVFAHSACIHYTYGNDVVDKDGNKLWRFDKRDWYHSVPKPRPYHPLPDIASPLQRLYQHAINTAMVAIWGREEGFDKGVESRHRDAGIADPVK